MASELQAFASVAPTITQPENTSSGELGGRGDDETHTYTFIYIEKKCIQKKYARLELVMERFLSFSALCK